MRNLFKITVLLLPLAAYAAVTQKQTLPKDVIEIGRPSPAADPQITFKGSTHKIKSNRTTNRIQFSNDGTNFKNLGSGSGGGSGTNLLQDLNFDFEQGTSNWTASGGTFAVESSTPLFELQSGKWDSNASSQTLSSSLKVIERGFIGRKCQAEILYRWPSGVAGDLKFQAVDQSSNVLAEVSLNPTTGDNVLPQFLTFDCPATATDQLRARLISTVSNAAEITVDNVFIGSGKNQVSISQSTLLGKIRMSGCTDWSRSNSAFGSFTATSGCSYVTSGNALAPSTFIPAIRFSSIPAGNIFIIARGAFTKTVSTTNADVSMRFSDGTNTWSEQVVVSGGTGAGLNLSAGQISGSFVYSSAQGPTTIEIQGKTSNTASGTAANISDDGGSTAATQINGLEIEVWHYPLQSADAITLETSGWYFDGNIGGANPGLSATSVGTYTVIANGGLDLVTKPGSRPGRITCGSGNPSVGSTCSAGGETVGVAVDLPYAGQWEACFDFTHTLGTNSGQSDAYFQVVRTSDTSETILEEGGTRVGSGQTATSATAQFPHKVCGVFNIASAGNSAFKLFYEFNLASGSVGTNQLAADRSGAHGQRDIRVTIKPINQQMPAPVFTEVRQKVESNASGERIERASFTCSGTSSITRQSGSWISSIGNVASGACTLTLVSGRFSSLPSCTISADQNSSGAIIAWHALVNSTTEIVVGCRADLAGTPANCTSNSAHIICMGPK